MERMWLIPVLILIVALGSVRALKNESSVSAADSTCKTEKCVMKCCPIGKYFKNIRENGILKRICSRFDNVPRDFATLAKEVFSSNTEVSKLNWTVKHGIFEANKTFKIDSVTVSGYFNLDITDYPTLILEHPNAYKRFTYIPNDMFCWDYAISKTRTSVDPNIWVVFPIDANEPSRTSMTLLTSAMLVSCVFLLIVLVVYAVLAELRNLCGRILMAYVTSQFFAFLLLAILRVQQHERETCKVLSFLSYYCFMATFFWMHVMSFDIWWTFRGYAKARPIHRRGEHFKFLMYCLYAFGLPLAMTIALIVLNEIDMSHMPWFVTPNIGYNSCFLAGGQELLYLYVPMLILILCNWVFYLMTAFNVWRLSRGTAVLDTAAAGTPHAHRTQRNRFMVYLKLSVVMGLNWVLEVVSSLYPGYNVWFISDFYNILIGVAIFLIFVCKRNILRKLVKRYLRCKNEWRPGQKDSMKSDSSTSESGSSQDTQTLQVCINPKGPAVSVKSV